MDIWSLFKITENSRKAAFLAFFFLFLVVIFAQLGTVQSFLFRKAAMPKLQFGFLKNEYEKLPFLLELWANRCRFATWQKFDCNFRFRGIQMSLLMHKGKNLSCSCVQYKVSWIYIYTNYRSFFLHCLFFLPSPPPPPITQRLLLIVHAHLNSTSINFLSVLISDWLQLLIHIHNELVSSSWSCESSVRNINGHQERSKIIQYGRIQQRNTNWRWVALCKYSLSFFVTL